MKQYSLTTLTRHDFRAVIYYNFATGLSKEECLKEMMEVFGEDCSSVRTLQRCYIQFQQGSFVLKDQPHTGRPFDVATPISVKDVWKVITLNRKITYRQLKVLLHIPKPFLQRIVSEQLSVRKLCIFWEPHALSDVQ